MLLRQDFPWKRLAYSLFITSLMLSPIPVLTRTEARAVDAGSVLYVGGSGPGNYTTIQAAFDAVHQGDAVCIYDDSAPYFEHPILQTDFVKVIGESNQTTVIDGSGTGTVFTIKATDCQIWNLNIQHSGSATLDAGIHLLTCTGVLVNDCHVSNSTVGFLVTDDFYSIVHRNNIQKCQTAITCLRTLQTQIEDNNITNSDNGVYGSQGDSLGIGDNVISSCKYAGITVDNLNLSIIRHNTIQGSKNALVALFSTNLRIDENNLTHPLWMGAWIADCIQTQIWYNTIIDSDGLGLYLSRSTNTTIAVNHFDQDDDGLLLEYTSNTHVHNNTFQAYKNNGFCITDTRSHHGNVWSDNFWGKPHHTPVLIPGRLKRNHHNYPFYSWDLHPASKPILPPRQDASASLQTTLYVGGDGPGNYTTIQAAIDNATDGDTILVYPGVYAGGILADKALTFQSANPQTTIINGEGYYDGITITHDNVSLQGFNITSSHFAVYILNASTIAITGNILMGNFHGITLRNAHTVILTHNSVYENQYGIRLYDSTTVTITHNILHNYKLDAYFLGSTPDSCYNTWTRNYWGKPSLIHLIQGKLIPPGQAGSPRWNLDWHPLREPELI